jgi:hypothetical protein
MGPKEDSEAQNSATPVTKGLNPPKSIQPTRERAHIVDLTFKPHIGLKTQEQSFGPLCQHLRMTEAESDDVLLSQPTTASP